MFYVSNPLRILAVEVDGLTSESISLSVVEPCHSDEAICSQTNATEVVEDHKFARVNGFSLLHNLSQHINGDKVEDVEVNHGLYISQGEGLEVIIYSKKYIYQFTEFKIPNNSRCVNSKHVVEESRKLLK